MKSFKKILSEVMQPRPEEERRFKAQHTTEVTPHPVAPETQHKGGLLKPKARRRADQDGDANYDKAYVVKEAADKASSDEASMAMEQADFIAYVAREMKEHLKAGKEFPEWMQNKLSKLQQAAQDLHSNFGDHGDEDGMDESYVSAAQRKAVWASRNEKGVKEELKGGQKKLDHNKNGKLDAHDFKLMRSKKMKEDLDEAEKKRTPAYLGTVHTDDPDYEKKVKELKSKAPAGGTRVRGRAPKAEFKHLYRKGGALHRSSAQDVKPEHSSRVDVYAKKAGYNEEVEQIDELSQNTLMNYHAKAAADLRKKREKLDKGTLTTKDYKQGRNRVTGLNRSAGKMESVEITEEFKQGIVKFKDKSQMILKKEDADALNNMFKGMSAANKSKMTSDAMESKTAFEEILGFAREA